MKSVLEPVLKLFGKPAWEIMALDLPCETVILAAQNPTCLLRRRWSALSGIRTAAALMKHPKSGVNSPNPADGCGCLCKTVGGAGFDLSRRHEHVTEPTAKYHHEATEPDRPDLGQYEPRTRARRELKSKIDVRA